MRRTRRSRSRVRRRRACRRGRRRRARRPVREASAQLGLQRLDERATGRGPTRAGARRARAGCDVRGARGSRAKARPPAPAAGLASQARASVDPRARRTPRRPASRASASQDARRALGDVGALDAFGAGEQVRDGGVVRVRRLLLARQDCAAGSAPARPPPTRRPDAADTPRTAPRACASMPRQVSRASAPASIAPAATSASMRRIFGCARRIESTCRTARGSRTRSGGGAGATTSGTSRPQIARLCSSGLAAGHGGGEARAFAQVDEEVAVGRRRCSTFSGERVFAQAERDLVVLPADVDAARAGREGEGRDRARHHLADVAAREHVAGLGSGVSSACGSSPSVVMGRACSQNSVPSAVDRPLEIEGLARPALRCERFARDLAALGVGEHRLVRPRAGSAPRPGLPLQLVVVGARVAGDQRLAESGARNRATRRWRRLRDRVGREAHAGDARVDHALDHDRHDIRRRQTPRRAPPDRRVARALSADARQVVDRRAQRCGPAHVEHRLVLAGEGGLVAVLAERRAAHGERAGAERGDAGVEISSAARPAWRRRARARPARAGPWPAGAQSVGLAADRLAVDLVECEDARIHAISERAAPAARFVAPSPRGGRRSVRSRRSNTASVSTCSVKGNRSKGASRVSAKVPLRAGGAHRAGSSRDRTRRRRAARAARRGAGQQQRLFEPAPRRIDDDDVARVDERDVLRRRSRVQRGARAVRAERGDAEPRDPRGWPRRAR